MAAIGAPDWGFICLRLREREAVVATNLAIEFDVHGSRRRCCLGESPISLSQPTAAQRSCWRLAEITRSTGLVILTPVSPFRGSAGPKQADPNGISNIACSASFRTYDGRRETLPRSRTRLP